jgi:hypothetical protein
VRRHLVHKKRDILAAAHFAHHVWAQTGALALVDRYAPPQVGQCKIRSAIPAVRRPEQREQGLVLVDCQELPVAQRPSGRREVESDHPDFTYKWFSHSSIVLSMIQFDLIEHAHMPNGGCPEGMPPFGMPG